MPAQLADTLAIVADVVDELRLAARKLRPLELDTLGLDAALRQACEEFDDLTKLTISYHGADPPTLPEAVSLAFYRLAQEALANIQAHAKATQVQVVLKSKDVMIKLQMKDNGRGLPISGEIDDPLDAPGLSLFGLMTRFQQLNGRVTIQSQRGQGTTITAVLPLG